MDRSVESDRESQITFDTGPTSVSSAEHNKGSSIAPLNKYC